MVLGTHSIHDSPDHYLALGQSLSDLSEGDLSDEGSEHADEALKVLSRMEKRFQDDELALVVRSRLIQSRVHAGQDRLQEAEKVLESVKKSLSDPDVMDPDTGIDFAKTLFRLGRDDQAKSLLSKLAQRFDDQPEILQKIENLLDEPVGFRQKLQARACNRDGIKAFESGDLQTAVAEFTEALKIVPAHAALNLNLVQVLMKQYHDGPVDPQLLVQCQQCLKRLGSLPEQHRQYRRYVALSRKLKGMMT